MLLSNRARKGISVVEVLVVTVVLGLLFYNIYRLLIPGMTIWMKSDKKVTLQQSALVSLYRIKDELKESNLNTYTYRQYDKDVDHLTTLICFASAIDKNGTLVNKTLHNADGSDIKTPNPDWQKYVIYYLDDRKRIRRHETDSYATMKQPDGMEMLKEPIDEIDLVRDKIISTRIEEFNVEKHNASPVWNGGVRLEIKAHDDDIDFSTTLETIVGMRYANIE